jgi:transcriptional regulator with XRE-family HTH domain
MVGPIVRRLRQERNLSQEALAESARVSSGYLSKLERGVYKQPSYDVLSRIAGALQIPTIELYRKAGIEHLLVETDPAYEPLFDLYASRMADLPKRDRDTITTEIHRIIQAERETEPPT